jgi:hypothetical protein
MFQNMSSALRRMTLMRVFFMRNQRGNHRWSHQDAWPPLGNSPAWEHELNAENCRALRCIPMNLISANDRESNRSHHMVL